MNAKNLLPFLITIAVAFAATGHSQIPRPGVGPTNPDRQNRDLETVRQIRLLDEQRLLEEQSKGGAPARDRAIVQAQVAKFMDAIKHRKHRFADFDQVV